MKLNRRSKAYISASKFELAILKKIKENDNGNSGCINLKHHFTWKNHPCFIFDLYGPTLDDVLEHSDNKGYQLPHFLVRDLTIQICNAVQFLHEIDIIHTDLKPNNILFVDPRMINFKLKTAAEHININMTNNNNNLLSWQIKLIDLSGSIEWKDKKENHRIQNMQYRAPEVILSIPWDKSCDIWSLGCIILKFMHRKSVFPFVFDCDGWKLIYCFNKMIGSIPDNLQNLVSGSMSWKIKSISNPRLACDVMSLKQYFDMDNEEHVELYDLVKKMMTWRGEDRLNAVEILNHAYFKMDTNKLYGNKIHKILNVPRIYKNVKTDNKSVVDSSSTK